MGTNPGTDAWYQALDKAPWTPPGWFFGFAWTSIMVCFSFFMAKWHEQQGNGLWSGISAFYALHWVLNVAWNPLFFRYHILGFSFLWILVFAILILALAIWATQHYPRWAWLVYPYALWLLVASSLNGYAYMYN